MAIGRRVHGWGKWFRIVGVVRDSKYHYLGESAVPYIFVPFRQVYRTDMQLAFYVRTEQDPSATLAALRAKTREIDPNVTVFDASPLREFIGESLYPQRVAAILLTGLGGLAVLLAAVGLYSVMAYSVVQRKQEIGIRMALGAGAANILQMLVLEGLKLAGIGLLGGTLLAIALARTIAAVSFTNSAMGAGAKLLHNTSDGPFIHLGACVFLCAVAALAAFVPARRAASMDPMKVLRTE
jgi:ABC-type antimicrobial peptide transport system permease subunit